MQVQMIGQSIDLPESQRYGVAHQVGCGDIARRVARHNKDAWNHLTVEDVSVIGTPQEVVWTLLADHVGDAEDYQGISRAEALVQVASRVQVCSCLRGQGGKRAFMACFNTEGN